MDHSGFAPAHCMCAFPVYTAQAPGCSAGELSKLGLGLHALLRFKPLRFRFSGTPQRCRHGWACILCPSQVQAAQATRCLVSTLSQVGVHLITSLVPAFISGVPCVSSGELISGCDPPGDVNCPGSQEVLVSNWAPAQFGGGCHFWGRGCPLTSGSGSRLPPSLPPAEEGAGLQQASSPLVFSQSFVL